MEINELWVRNNLWALCYAWERGAGNILSHDPDLATPLMRYLISELRYAISDPREGEWETEIAKIVETTDEEALIKLVQWIATDSKSAASIMASKSREHPTDAQREASRKNGRKGGRPKHEKTKI